MAAIVAYNALADSIMDEISRFVEENCEAEILLMVHGTNNAGPPSEKKNYEQTEKLHYYPRRIMNFGKNTFSVCTTDFNREIDWLVFLEKRYAD